jgi:hypothetical protein
MLSKVTNRFSCLYHTVNILVHRTMLSSHISRDTDLHHDRKLQAEECLSSANEIVTIFDLFRRTFGLGFVILSLGYSIYTAVSVFLHEREVSPDGSSPSSDRLEYCIEVLEIMQNSSPSMIVPRPEAFHMLTLANSCG